VTTDLVVWLLGVALEATVMVVVLRTRIARLLPVFFLFTVWNLVTDLGSKVVQAHFGYTSPQYFRLFVVEYSLDGVMQSAVLVELAWSVLRPYRSVLPRGTIIAIAALVFIAGALIWPFTGIHGLPPAWVPLMRIQQTAAVLKILFFLALAGLSQFLVIGWRNRELQVATGLGFYSLMTLGQSMLHTHRFTADAFHLIDTLVSVSYCLCLVYWSGSFLQKEAPRQEFSPGMQNLLLTVAAGARTSRVELDERRKIKR
jgi:hypothetical protein